MVNVAVAVWPWSSVAVTAIGSCPGATVSRVKASMSDWRCASLMPAQGAPTALRVMVVISSVCSITGFSSA